MERLAPVLIASLVPVLCGTASAAVAVQTPAVAAPGVPVTAAPPACARTVDLPTLHFEPIAPGVWRVPAARGGGTESNGGLTAQLVLARDGTRVWLIGAGPSPALGVALACEARRAAGGDVTDVVITRAAPELAMGSAAFPRARLWALAEVIAAMHARCGACQQRLAARIGSAGASLTPETIRVPDRRVDAGGAARGRLGPFDWRAFERAPGEPVLVPRHRRAGIVVAQGLLWAGDVPDLAETRSDSLLAAWRGLRRFAAGARVIGEQGEPSSPTSIDDHIGYVEALRAAIEPRLARGDVQGADVILPRWAGLPSAAERHPLNVQRVWRELEPTIFR